MLWQVRMARHLARRLGGQLGSGAMKTMVHVVGLNVRPLYFRAFVVILLLLSLL
jgi:hypothetical protein